MTQSPPFPSRPRAWAQRLLKLMGWSLDLAPPPGPKMVLVMYPHTSNWDFALGIIARAACGWPIRWLGKHTLFHAPFGGLFRWLGGIPVDHESPGSLLDDITTYCREHPHAVIAIAPEGTRGYVDSWKSGFHRIARAAAIPIAAGYIDYRHKRVGIAGYIEATDDIAADMARLADYYEETRARFPDQAGAIATRPRSDAPSEP